MFFLLITSPPVRGEGFPLVFFCRFFLLVTCVASYELLPSLLLPCQVCREDDRRSFFFSGTDAQKHGHGQGETTYFVHMMHASCMNMFHECHNRVTGREH